MSFSSEVKEEISKINNWNNKETITAEIIGYMLSSNVSYSEKNGYEYITENEFNIERFYKLLFNKDIEYEPEIVGKLFVAKIKCEKDFLVNIYSEIDINKDVVQRAIVRGAFLGSGSINEPSKKYHLEIIFSKKENGILIQNMLNKFFIKSNLIQKKTKNNEENFLLYIKEGEEISKFLAMIEAKNAVLNFEDIRVVREMRNNVNRIVNCETANLNKIVNASVSQIEDIKFIQKMNKFDTLPDYLKEIAIVRIENPESSLKELGELLDNPIGKSGVNHRLKKIQEIAEEIRKGNYV